MTPSEKNLDSKLAQFLSANAGKDSSFPFPDHNYFDRYRQLDAYLNDEIHPAINQAATAKSHLWLTDHGPDHVSTVIRRASDLVFRDEHCALSPYEAYLLLLAIHFHDTGNVFGREGHETRITDIMLALDQSLLGDDAGEQRLVRDVAMAHGGYAGEHSLDKDTIGRLPYQRLGRNGSPRPHLLAAILRFADELAEDHTRTSRFLVANRLIEPAAEAYHLYADRLRRVNVCASEQVIDLNFEIDETLATRKVSKDTNKIFLFDEIQNRLIKMHKEHVYCAKFMEPLIHFSHIAVDLKVCAHNYMDVLWHVDVQIAPVGYPAWPTVLGKICAQLDGWDGRKLSSHIRARNADHPGAGAAKSALTPKKPAKQKPSGGGKTRPGQRKGAR
jgi:hypothetical protein